MFNKLCLNQTPGFTYFDEKYIILDTDLSYLFLSTDYAWEVITQFAADMKVIMAEELENKEKVRKPISCTFKTHLLKTQRLRQTDK